MKCPMSNETFRGACPVKSCPYNNEKCERSCSFSALSQIDDVADRVNYLKRVVDPRIMIAMQRLGAMVEDLNVATEEAAPAHACEHCGHPECVQDHACYAREKVNTDLGLPVKPSTLWYAAASGRSSFLSAEAARQIAPLVGGPTYAAE